MQRRSFLGAILAAGIAPVYVPFKSLMVPPSKIWTPPPAFKFKAGYAQCEPFDNSGARIIYIYSGAPPANPDPDGPATGTLLATLSVPAVGEWLRLTDLPVRAVGEQRMSFVMPK